MDDRIVTRQVTRYCRWGPLTLGLTAIAALLLGACAGAGPKPAAVADSHPPEQPVLSELMRDQTSLTVAWTAPTSDEAVTGYELRWRAGSGTGWTVIENLPSTTTSYQITGLTPDTLHDIQVHAVSAAGMGERSESVSAMTEPRIVTGLPAPTVSEATADQNSMTVTWTAPTTTLTITSYDLRWRASSDTAWTEMNNIPSTATNYHITGLAAGTLHEIQVRAVAAASTGAWSESVSQTTEQTTGPGGGTTLAAPTVSEATADQNSVTVTWAAPTTTLAITGYELRWRAGSGAWTVINSISSTATSYQITGLAAGTQHEIQVRAVAGTVYGDWESLTVTTSTTTIIEDTIPTLRVGANDFTPPEADVGTTTAFFFITTDDTTTSDITVNYSVSETGDMVAASDEGNSQEDLNAGSGNASIQVTIQSDTVAEPDSTVTVTLQTGPGYLVGSPSSASTTVADND